MSFLLSTWGEGVGFPACITGHIDHGGVLYLGGGGVEQTRPPPTRTGKAGGMHPTGMLSCLFISLLMDVFQQQPTARHSDASLITARKRSCGKVMFLHLSVILFTGGRGVFPSPTPRQTWRGWAEKTPLGRPGGVRQTPP